GLVLGEESDPHEGPHVGLRINLPVRRGGRVHRCGCETGDQEPIPEPWTGEERICLLEKRHLLSWAGKPRFWQNCVAADPSRWERAAARLGSTLLRERLRERRGQVYRFQYSYISSGEGISAGRTMRKPSQSPSV